MQKTSEFFKNSEVFLRFTFSPNLTDLTMPLSDHDFCMSNDAD